MKIDRLVCSDFLGLKSVDVTLPGGVSLFLGANGQGKSSLLDAIRWGLTGKCRGLKRKNQMGSVVRIGAKRAELKMDVSAAPGSVKEFSVERKRTLTVEAGPSASDLESMLGGAESALVSCLGAWEFLALPDAERSALVMGVFGGPTEENVSAELTKAGISGDLRRWVMAELVKSSFDFPAVHALAVSERVAAKRAAADFSVPSAPVSVSVGGKDMAVSTLLDMDAEKRFSVRESEARAERDRYVSEIAKLKSSHRNPKKIAQEALDAWVEALGLDFVEELRELREGAVERADAVQVAEARIAASLEVAGQGVPGSERCPCPETSGVERCPVRSGAVDKDLASLRGEVARLQNLDARMASLAAREARYNALRAAVDEAQEVDGDRAGDSTRISEMEAKCAELAERAENSRVAKEAVEKAGEAADAVVVAVTKRDLLNHAIARWDAVCKCLEPGGVPAVVSGGGVHALNTRLRAHAPFIGLGVSVSADLSISRDDGLDFSLLSRSEQWRVAAAIAEAISHCSGLRFLCLDEADVLVQEAQGRFLSWLMALAPEYDQILVFGSAKSIPTGAVGGLAMWLVDGGCVSPIC